VHEQFLVHNQSRPDRGVRDQQSRDVGDDHAAALSGGRRARPLAAPSSLPDRLALYGPILLAVFLPAFEISLISARTVTLAFRA